VSSLQEDLCVKNCIRLRYCRSSVKLNVHNMTKAANL